MSFQYTPYIWPSVVATLLCASMLPAIWRRRTAPGALAYFFVMLVVIHWTTTQGLQFAAVGADAKVLIAKIQYIGIASTGPLLFVFAMAYNGWRQWLTPTRLSTIALIPLITLLLVFTNESHGLIWAERSVGVGAIHPRVLKYGPWFPVFTAYSYGMIFVSALLILWKFGHSKHHRGQVILLSLAPMIPVAFNVFYLLDRERLGGLDATPIGFSVSITLCALALFRYRLFDLRPIAREAVFEGLGDAVVVLDSQSRLADVNPRARTLFGRDASDLIGYPANELLPEPLTRLALDREPETTEFEIVTEGQRRIFDAKVSSLDSTSPVGGGRVVLLRDVTDRKHAEEELRSASDELQKANEELNRLVNRDPLTELGNRRSFFERLDTELERQKRYGEPLSLLLVDLDHFKEINDRHGHPVGDQVLIAVARVLEDCRFDIDLIARLGGEEFGLILPNTDRQGAAVLAERLRQNICELTVTADDGEPVKITASLGIAALRDTTVDVSDLMRAADRALYRAKAEGRNRVAGATPDTLGSA